MGFPQFLVGAFPSRSRESEEEGTELANRRKPLELSPPGERILLEISSRSYICGICVENVVEGSSREHGMWHCKECHNVYHFHCVKTWRDIDRIASAGQVLANLRPQTWKCPGCMAEHEAIEDPRCWCGRRAHPFYISGRPNGCNITCAKLGRCAHGTTKPCQQSCHPGPCNIPCTSACPATILTPQGIISWDRFCSRVHDRKKGTIRTMAKIWGFLLLWYGMIGVFAYFHLQWWIKPYFFHLQWWIKPYFFPNFLDDLSSLEIILVAILGFIFHFVIAGKALKYLNTATREFMVTNLNLRSSNVRSLDGRYILRQFGTGVLYVFFVVAFALPAIGLGSGPDVVWNSRMKDSCLGFNTRIPMITYSGVPTAKFLISRVVEETYLQRYSDHNSLASNGTSQAYYRQHSNKTVLVSKQTGETYYIASRIEPNGFCGTPFQFYHRLSGSIATAPSIAVDIDIENHAWRIMNLSSPDTANEWLAYGSKQSRLHTGFPSLPILDSPLAALIRNGTFSKISEDEPHLHLPELEFTMADMYKFMHHCSNEPFVRVFDVSPTSEHGTTSAKAEDVINKEWTTRPHEREVLRTASFGLGRQRLAVCIRNEQIRTIDLVPFAILSAYRQRVHETDLRDLKCGDEPDPNRRGGWR